MVSAAQPAFSNLSGTATLAQLPTIGNNTILSNISGGSSTPLGNGLSAIIDNSIASTQGDILYRGASTWSALAPGTMGQVLSSGGTAANPSWTTVSGTGTVTSVATNNGLTGGTITTGGTIGLATIAAGNVLAYTGAGSGVPVATVPSTLSLISSVRPRGTFSIEALQHGLFWLRVRRVNSCKHLAPGLRQAGHLRLRRRELALVLPAEIPSLLSSARQTLPTIQRFTSGSAATYTSPPNVLWIRVRMVGGGAGGGGGGTSGGGNGTAGNSTTFSTFTAAGGAAGQAEGGTGGGAGGSASAGGNVANIGGGGGGGGSPPTATANGQSGNGVGVLILAAAEIP